MMNEWSHLTEQNVSQRWPRATRLRLMLHNTEQELICGFSSSWCSFWWIWIFVSWLPVVTSCCIPLTDIRASLIPFPSSSFTMPLIPRWAWGAQDGSLTKNNRSSTQSSEHLLILLLCAAKSLCFSQYSPAAIILGNRSSSKHSYCGGMALHKWRLMAFANSLTKKWCVLKMVLDPSSVGSVHPSAKRNSVNNALTASINAIKASWFSCQARNNSSSGGNLSQPSSTVTSKQLVWR